MNETGQNTERNENEFNYPRAVVRTTGNSSFSRGKKKEKKKGDRD